MKLSRALAPVLVAILALTGAPPVGHRPAAAAEGTLTWGVHVTLAPTWFDPAETPGMITPFMVLYALHDAMVKPTTAPRSPPKTPSSRSTAIAARPPRASRSASRPWRRPTPPMSGSA